MKHLILSREYPPAPYPAGGIGTYVRTITELLAETGETVHVIGQRWEGADRAVEVRGGGRLVIHRVASGDPDGTDGEALGLLDTHLPAQWFAWRAGRLAETLIEREGIDVIEGQDWEAPLYYLLLRRALGLGPERRPPCIVHLHSPTEFIFRANDWELDRPDYLPLKRAEEYVIGAADAHLCPSRFLARQAAAHYGLPGDSIQVIPLPLGVPSVHERPSEVWRRGTVCYVGRLEPRKGVLEWVEAVVSVARDYRDVEFELIGADLPYTDGVSVRQVAVARIPEALRHRFRFRGPLERHEIARHLAAARAAVVPSRWENFPNTCVEAMASGVPVIASPNGGMPEMVTDGETGWIAATATPAGLAAALRRALETPPHVLASMGRAAAQTIRRLCDNRSVVAAHMECRARVARQGAQRSLCLPPNLPWTLSRPATPPAPRRPGAGSGIAVIVTSMADGDALADALTSIASQTLMPVAVALVVEDPIPPAALPAVEWARARGWIVASIRERDRATAANAGVAAVRRTGAAPFAWVFMEDCDRLGPGATAAYAATFAHRVDVGLVSSWVRYRDRDRELDAAFCPAFPYQWLSNGVAPVYAVRDEPLREAGPLRGDMYPGFDRWDFANAVMAAGWPAVTYPALLAERATGARGVAALPGTARMLQRLLARFPQLVAWDAEALVLLRATTAPARRDGVGGPRAAPGPTMVAVLRRPLREQLALARRAMLQPRRTAAWLWSRLTDNARETR